jgi:hypothetical protein
LRFAVHWPPGGVASPRFHGVPRRDVPGRVRVSVGGIPADHAKECRLALAGFLSDVSARRAALARVGRGDSFPGVLVVLDRLLLHDDGPSGEPGVVRSGLGQLPAPFGESGHLPAPGPVLVFLLHAQVPHVAGVRAVPHQHRFLLRRRLKTVPRHTNIIARLSSEGSAVRNSPPCSARHWFPSRPEGPSLRGRH